MKRMKRVKKVMIFLMLGLGVLSCKDSSKEKHCVKSDHYGNIDTTLICNLEENMEVIQNIDDAKFLNDSIFFVITNKQLIKYNISGKQVELFANRGNAPYIITPKS